MALRIAKGTVVFKRGNPAARHGTVLDWADGSLVVDWQGYTTEENPTDVVLSGNLKLEEIPDGS